MRGPMKLIDPHYGLMECRVCGWRHGASVKSGRYKRGSYQCTNALCPSNDKEWDDAKERNLVATTC